MKIRLLEDLPIAKEHGAFEGLEVEAEYVPSEERGSSLYRFVSPTSGETIGVLSREAEVISERKASDATQDNVAPE